MKAKVRKCAYVRVSTEAEEQESSLLFQTHYYKSLIESEKDSEFVGIYADTRSGESARLRKQFKAMIYAAKRGEINYIYTKSIARFARNLVETLNVVRELRERNVGIYFEKEGIDTLKSSSDFMLSIYATVAEGELKSMGDNVRWAARKRFQQGSVELTYIYGYDIIDGQLYINPNEAKIVKEIFQRYLDGEGLSVIARSLNDRGVPRKTTTPKWRSNDLMRMLVNEKYCGDALLQKSIMVDSRKVTNNGEVPQYYVENNHEAIISREMFDKAQEIKRQRSAKMKKPAKVTVSPFSRKIKCLECDKNYLHRKNNRNTPYEKWIFSCYTYVQFGRKHCSGRNIREKDLKELFLSAYNEAADFEPHEIKNLDEAIKDLLAQERALIGLKAKGYIKPDDYTEQHKELLRLIKDTEDEFMLQTQYTTVQNRAEMYSDRLVSCLERAEISGFNITFKFKNGAEVKRVFNNDADRKATWDKKLGR